MPHMGGGVARLCCKCVHTSIADEAFFGVYFDNILRHSRPLDRLGAREFAENLNLCTPPFYFFGSKVTASCPAASASSRRPSSDCLMARLFSDTARLGVNASGRAAASAR